MARDQMTAFKRSRIRRKTHRLIATQYPTVGVFDDLTSDPGDLRAAFNLEAITNDRLAAQRINLLPEEEIISGAVGSGASIVMAAFLHADEAGGRFTDRRLGGWYAAFELDTAIAETMYHNDRRLRLSDGGFPNRIQIRELIVNIQANLVDVRGHQKDRPELYRDTDYSASQAFAAEIRWPKSPPPENGIVFDSVRRKSGTNVCIFWPSKVPLPVIQGDHFEYQWDAAGNHTVRKLTNVEI
jgi:RES domain